MRTKPSRVACGLCLCLAALGGAAGCAKKARPDSPTAALAAADVPKRWSELRLPAEGLTKVLARTDAHGYYADYAGIDAAALWSKVTAALSAARYQPACSVLDGNVRGFARGAEKLAVKIDSLGGVALSIFDEQGSEPLLHGVCFGRHQLGPPRVIKPSGLEK